MRTLLTSIVALLLSSLAGSAVVQALAVTTNATEEFIVAFAFVPVAAVVLTFIFFVAQLAGPRPTIDRVARWIAVLLLAATLVLFGFEYWADAGNLDLVRRALPLLGALALSAWTVLVVHWLFVRWRARAVPPPMHFGRGAQ
ncbi:MAG: hypothetical protein KF849_10800 [Rhizobiaceae bacterium]|nr:hypothetical protein [Rhizobiaceae bacterium]